MKFGFGFICLGDYTFTFLMHSGLNQNVIFKAVILMTVSSYINMFALKFSILFFYMRDIVLINL